MANKNQLAILGQGINAWNKWREKNPDKSIDFRGANLSGDNLAGGNFDKVDFYKANLSNAFLEDARFQEAYMRNANLSNVHSKYVNFREANLLAVNFEKADLEKSYFARANLNGANFQGANLKEVSFGGATLRGSDLREVNLSGLNFRETDFRNANLRKANFSDANLRHANFSKADISGAKLNNADLTGAHFVNTKVAKAIISGSFVYAINVWGVEGEFKEQKNLIITQGREPVITVDNIKVAQFIYLILNNQEIRDVISTLTSKSVLILGRFSCERKKVLVALKKELRKFDFIPILFDFKKASSRDFTETIKILAGLSYFVIADITNPKSSPLELQATIPDYQIPFIPIIQEGEKPFSMMSDLHKYNWVLDTISYNSIDSLLAGFEEGIIKQAREKHEEIVRDRTKQQKVPTPIENFVKS